jgi:hypothetical protein
MRLLMIAHEGKTPADLKNFSGVYSYFLAEALRSKGHDVQFVPRPWNNDEFGGLDTMGADHVIAAGIEYFDRLGGDAVLQVKRRTRGKVCQFADKPLRRSRADLTFCFKGDGWMPGQVVIGWGADPSLCVPRQSPDELRILIDHPDYVAGRGDETERVVKDCQQFASGPLWKKQFHSVRIVRWTSDGFVDGVNGPEGFRRSSAPFTEACEQYGRAHLFVMTHPESIGLSVLECAMAGALPVVRRGFMDAGLLKTVRTVEYADQIPWPAVLEKIDPVKSRSVALQNTWKRSADRMIEALQ